MKLSTTFNPQTDDQTIHTIRNLEDIVSSCTIDFMGIWDKNFPLLEFAYNNSFHSSISMASYEALYGRRCGYPIGWFEVGESSLLGSDMVYKTLEKVHIIRNCLKTAYSWQKSYADHTRRDLEFEEGDKVYLKILPMKRVARFGNKGKLSPRYMEPYEILHMVD